MIHIALCCSAAMSTSLLVDKMNDEADKQGIQTYIYTTNIHEIEMAAKDADIILIAPQVQYAKKEIQKAVSPIPVIEISMKDFGLMNGKGILNQVLSLIQKK